MLRVKDSLHEQGVSHPQQDRFLGVSHQTALGKKGRRRNQKERNLGYRPLDMTGLPIDLHQKGMET